jgi:hypothetical protein
MKYIGIKATAEQVQAIRDCMSTPLILLQCGPPQSPLDLAHRYAIEQGLPEIPGRYGIDLKTGEFVQS